MKNTYVIDTIYSTLRERFRRGAVSPKVIYIDDETIVALMRELTWLTYLGSPFSGKEVPCLLFGIPIAAGEWLGMDFLFSDVVFS